MQRNPKHRGFYSIRHMLIRMKKLFFVCILLFAGCASDGPNTGGCAFAPNITAVRNESDVGLLMQKVLNGLEISGYVYGTPVYDSETGLWLSETSLNTGYVLLTYVNDSDLSVHEVLFRAPVPDLDIPPGSSKVGNASCEENGRILVYVFEDPYCPGCISSANYISELMERFASDPMDFRWKYFPTHSLYPNGIIANYGEAVVELAAKYYMCAEEQGLINEFKTCSNNLFNERLQTAEEEIPLVGTELDNCAVEVAMDIEILTACLNRTDIMNRTESDVTYGLSIGIDTTPSTVVNCMYAQKLNKLMLTLCAMNESFKGCE